MDEIKNKRFPAQDIKLFLSKLFQKIDVPRYIYKTVVNGLVLTSLRGVDSHGIRLAPHYIRAAIIGRINKHPHISFRKTAVSTGILDADHTYGIIAGYRAMSHAIALARETGIGAVVVVHSSHFGSASLYTLEAAHHNMLGMSFTHTESLVVPYGGRRPLLGTNPICFTAPCEGEEPFCVDIATSMTALNVVRMCQEAGKKLDNGWAVDNKGTITTNPQKAVALLPIAGYKGYGLAFMVEILCSALTGMPFGYELQKMFPLNKKKRNLGHFFIAVNIQKFQSVGTFKKRLKEFMEYTRKQPTAYGTKEILVPGDPEKRCFQERSKHGIPIPEELIEDFCRLAEKLSVKHCFD